MVPLSPNLSLLCLFVVSVTSLMRLKNGSPECLQEGRFPHPEDCSEYVDCVPDDNTANLDVRIGSCRGGAFNPDQRKCLSAKMVKNCSTLGRKPRSLFSDPVYEDICQNESEGFYCANCRTLVKCIGGYAYPEPCRKGDMCDVRQENFGGAVCYPASPEACTCSNSDELRVDPYNNRLFFACKPEDQAPISYECPHHMTFDTEARRCVYSDGLHFSCSDTGVFADTSDCSLYYNCIFTTDGWLRPARKCPCGFMYNEYTNQCENPCTWQFSCMTEGRFPDPLDCDRYYECVANVSHHNGFRQILAQCPDGSSWQSGSGTEGQGLCVPAWQNEDCRPVRPSGCVVPDRWCIPVTSAEPECDQESEHCECSPDTGRLSCRLGYYWDGEACQDSVECEADVNPCDPNAACENNEGSFVCTCLDGFIGDGIMCEDIDECGDPNNYPCLSSTICVNSVSSYTCQCQPGFFGDGISICQDINECTVGSGACDSSAVCENTEGSYVCTCPEGYESDGFRCLDVDECNGADGSPCGTQASCHNSQGSFSCECLSGYTGDGFFCEDIDECRFAPSLCGANFICENQEGSYDCVCEEGFMHQGSSCVTNCEEIGLRVDDYCYYLGEGMLTWGEAQLACTNDNAALAVIYGMRAPFIRNKFASAVGSSNGVWTAGRRNTANTWIWPSSEPILTGNFITVEGFGTNETCLTLAQVPNSSYRGSECGSSRLFLCYRKYASPTARVYGARIY